MAVLARLMRFAERAVLALSILALLVIICAMSAQVIWRYLLNAPLRWSETLAVFGLVWLVFLGAAELMARDQQVSISTVVDLLPPRLRAVLAIGTRLATLIFVGVFLYIGLGWLNRSTHQFNHVLGLSTIWAKMALPLGGGFMVLFTLRHLVADIRRLRDHPATRGGE
ncbi:TRAP transporter small permease [Microbulbifer sp. S227A]|uniref:TRAP transporter small permease n=1 Tax=Microbulbifer sp. S227A TaxID=3415131 RepID=UPI003C7DCDDC